MEFYLLDYCVYAFLEVPDFLGPGWDFYDEVFVGLGVVVDKVVEIYVPEIIRCFRTIDLSQNTSHHIWLLQQTLLRKRINNPKPLLNFRNKLIPRLTNHQSIRILRIIKKFTQPPKLLLINLINLNLYILKL